MLKIYNTATKKVESFTPRQNGKVGMYNCGPTVYSRVTIGNLRSFLLADLLKRVFSYLDFEVLQVMNITDVGHLTMTDEQKSKLNNPEITDTEIGVDRMEKAAKRENMTVWEVAEYYTKLFLEDIEKLNIGLPNHMPKATDHIDEQIVMINDLISKGYAYVTKTAVYFDTSRFPGYGLLAGQDLDQKAVAVRDDVEYDSTKRNPADFRLWQLNQPDHSMQWDSPWGKGYPGWHIECSAMSLKYLQQPIDIHTGGVDHIAVHHPNEIAQSEAATGQKFVNYWMHGAFLTVDGKRMGKSLGNAYTLEDVALRVSNLLALRYFFLTAHYRQVQNFTWDSLEAADKRLTLIIDFAKTCYLKSKGETKGGKIISVLEKKFREAIENDINMPIALAVLSELLEYEAAEKDLLVTLKQFDQVLGIIDWEEIEKCDLGMLNEINEKIDERNRLRNNKQWSESDAIRDYLFTKYLVQLEDRDGVTTWRISSTND
ncbi:MAG: cysteine--tRNA ligase [Candidatus Dojkabacteria bacterium]|uniref:Cysteine--tRNA ligase n=2 Tax=Candidatus Dojkabacteria TaxID=74243 RepID=A0A952DVA3_9BACT|nr:cysteine--tRNA ligase [Candidatus Dojkabacteria bacterium]WKZ28394.1 MAG: cysteine--tRNA ligase [Candidatus Dojkabacteria bacterium]